jgi:hypothetical protein
MSNPNTSTTTRGTNKMGRKLAAALIAQSLSHVLDGNPKLSRWEVKTAQYRRFMEIEKNIAI